MTNQISSEARNRETVQTLYAAFGRGDVPAILAMLAEDIDWEYGYAPGPIPWLTPGRGHAAAAAFFQTLGAALEFQRFEVKGIATGPDLVVALVDIEVRVKATGRIIREIDEPHVWRFDAAGRVAKFRHGADTAQHAAALRA